MVWAYPKSWFGWVLLYKFPKCLAYLMIQKYATPLVRMYKTFALGNVVLCNQKKYVLFLHRSQFPNLTDGLFQNRSSVALKCNHEKNVVKGSTSSLRSIAPFPSFVNGALELLWLLLKNVCMCSYGSPPVHLFVQVSRYDTRRAFLRPSAGSVF